MKERKLNMIKNPKSHGFPELWFVREIAKERGISLQTALTLIRKNSKKGGTI